MQNHGSPFVIFALPRSKTFWLSKFLSYGEYQGYHDYAVNLRTLVDFKSAVEMNCVGWVETTAALYWQVIREYRKDAKFVVVKRDVDEVLESLKKVTPEGVLDFAKMRKSLIYLDKQLDLISKEPGTLVVSFAELKTFAGAKAVFEHCLPYQFDEIWWSLFNKTNLQINFGQQIRLVSAFAPQIDRFQKIMKGELRRLVEIGKIGTGPFVSDNSFKISEGTMDELLSDGMELIEEHKAEVGTRENHSYDINFVAMKELEALGEWKVFTVRKNNSLLGYMMFRISVSLENKNETFAIQSSTFISPSIRGKVLIPLLDKATEYFKSKNVDEIFLREGNRAGGGKTGILYRRRGAKELIKLYSLRLKEM